MQSAIDSITPPKTKHALIICDLQSDLLQSISCPTTKESLLDFINICIDVALQAGSQIILTGVQFTKGYPEVPVTHKIYGGFRRLADKMKCLTCKGSCSSVEWFLQDKPGAQITAGLSLPNHHHHHHQAENNLSEMGETITTIWRHQHLPAPRLLEKLAQDEITHVTVMGIKAAYAVQATCQAICDMGITVSVVPECIQDDDQKRRLAVLEHLLPIYANIISLTDFVVQMIGLEAYQYREPTFCSKDAAGRVDTGSHQKQHNMFLLANCGRGGHGPIFMSHLLERTTWRTFPLQEWYGCTSMLNGGGKQYHCPLGKRVVDFCDEPQFSRICMFLKGREWLDEKEKIIELAGDLSPETFVVQRGRYVDNREPKDCDTGPWFVKDTNKNGGKAIKICEKASQCLDLTIPGSTYVVQRHIQNPRLTLDGRKCHLKFYSLLVCEENEWDLYCYKDAFHSISPNRWSAADTSLDTQITVKRNKRLKFGTEQDDAMSSWWSLEECQQAVKTIVTKAIQTGKLQERPGKKQFEIFSADLMANTSGKIWIIEFNFSPVLYDPVYFTEDKLTTAGLRLYHDRYHRQCDHEINDRPMIQDALSIVFDSVLPNESRWTLSARIIK